MFPGKMLFFFQPLIKGVRTVLPWTSLFTLKKSVFQQPRIPMKRFLSSRSSSQQELQPVDDVRAERAAIALSVGLELATRQVHEDAPRPAQPAAALGTSPAGAHHEPPPAPAGHQHAAPGLVATRRSHRPVAHTRGARPSSRRLVLPRPPRPLKTSPAAVHRSAARSSSIPLPGTGSSTCWTSGRPSDDGTCGGACARSSVCAPGCSTGSTRPLPTAGSGARHEQRRATEEAC